MLKWIRKALFNTLYIAPLAILTACGGGGGLLSGPAPDPDADVNVSSVQVLVSSTQLRSDGSDSIDVTAIAKDSNNNLMPNVPVVISASSGNLTVSSNVTNDIGLASATLDSKGNPANRVITVTANAGSQSASTSVTVSGTVITISAPPSAAYNQPISIPLAIKAIDIPLAERSLTVSATNATINSQPAPSDTGGETTVTITATANPVTITVSESSLGATSSASVPVTTDFITLASNPTTPYVELGASRTLTANLKCGGVNTQGVDVRFTSTRGTLAATSRATDVNGNATNSINSNTSGPALITASATCPSGQSVQHNLELNFIATVPARVDVQAEPTIVTANQLSSTANQSQITAIVRDANNNLVYNKIVSFTLTDSTGGSLSATTATTDLYGRAKVNYIAGTSASAKDGVVITATVQGTSITHQTTLTVAGLSLFITLGTGNSILEPNTTTYSKPWSLLVTGPAGDPIKNATVTVAIISNDYRKGNYEWPDNGTAWKQIVTATCANEDINHNGLLDSHLAEDTNNNSKLEPGNVASTSVNTLTTDSNGFAYFNVNYAQQYANWVNVTLEATASVSGSENVEQATFWLEGLGTDFNDQGINPPGNPSPFGTSSSCANTL